MGILKKIGKCVDVLLEDDEKQSTPPITKDEPDANAERHAENYEKGVLFEKHVVGLFDQKYFVVHDWTRDLSGKTKGYVVESDSNPDIVMRYKQRDEQIAIECKFRSSLYQGMLQWTTEKKLRGYRAYMKKTGIATSVVIGLGGSPDMPERMFCIPLTEAKYPGLYPSLFEKFERSPSKKFFWDGTLLV